MLTFYTPRNPLPISVPPGSSELPPSVTWIDVFDPTPDELVAVKQMLGTRIPTFAELSEIESSSRLAVEDGTLFMSMPATLRDPNGFSITTPIGFVIGRDRLATIRFAALPSFAHFVRDVCAKGDLPADGLGVAVPLLETIIDQIADVLEKIGSDLDKLSHNVFANGLQPNAKRRPRRAEAALVKALRAVGESGDLGSKMSESLLAISRMVPFINSKGSSLLTPELRGRLDTLLQDTSSLREYVEHLSNKTQFMLDTLLGLANIDQNNVFRVLTVVSVVGIPPTFFASMYGMNFKNMPEYDWAFGYQYGLTLIVLSGLLPAIWFKVKGWW